MTETVPDAIGQRARMRGKGAEVPTHFSFLIRNFVNDRDVVFTWSFASSASGHTYIHFCAAFDDLVSIIELLDDALQDCF